MMVNEIIQLIENSGWYLDRTRGSHRQYKHTTSSVIAESTDASMAVPQVERRGRQAMPCGVIIVRESSALSAPSDPSERGEAPDQRVVARLRDRIGNGQVEIWVLPRIQAGKHADQPRIPAIVEHQRR